MKQRFLPGMSPGLVRVAEAAKRNSGRLLSLNPHDALRALDRGVHRGEINWVLDADIVSYFDQIDRKKLKELLQRRIADKSLMRLIGKCLHVGVLESGEITTPETGTAQGSTLSPLLVNAYLHYVLDQWFEQEVKPRLTGKASLFRFADDFLIGFERREDAEKVLRVLEKRQARYGLELHPDKTRMVDFRRPPRKHKGPGPETFDFLGFTIVWKRNRRGGWYMGTQTRVKKLRRAKKAAHDLCRSANDTNR